MSYFTAEGFIRCRTVAAAAVASLLFGLGTPAARGAPAADAAADTAARGESVAIRPLVTLYWEALGVPALTAAQITPERIVTTAVGVRVLGRPMRVRVDDRFHTGSDAKAMFATVVARAIEAGRLRWDTTLEEVFPELVTAGGTAYRHVTLEDLLRHRSGLPALEQAADLATVPVFRGTPTAQRAAFTAWALRQPPTVPPRSTAQYSNGGYVVAAALVERATRQTFEKLMARELYAPLCIDAHYDWPAAAEPFTQPWGHEEVDGQFVARSPYWPPARIPAWLRPAVGVSITTREFARFVQLHLRGLLGMSDYLAPDTFARLHTPIDGYGIGWLVAEVDGRPVSVHVGASGLFAAAMWIDPLRRGAGVAMSNADSELVEFGVQQLAAVLAAGDSGVGL